MKEEESYYTMYGRVDVHSWSLSSAKPLLIHSLLDFNDLLRITYAELSLLIIAYIHTPLLRKKDTLKNIQFKEKLSPFHQTFTHYQVKHENTIHELAMRKKIIITILRS